ncbi:MAG TPA: hypothetical protein VFQ88_09440 [Nevskiaceae bacterium]|nr:hypothetical protein [Nevskiaceae bacterium]
MPSSVASSAPDDRPALHGTYIDRDLIRRHDPVALNTLARLSRKICGGFAYRYGVSRYADDISQDVLIAFLHTNETPRPDEANIPVEAFFLKAGHRAALTCMRATKRMRGLREGETFDDLVEHESPEHDGEDAAGSRRHRRGRRAAPIEIEQEGPDAPESAANTGAGAAGETLAAPSAPRKHRNRLPAAAKARLLVRTEGTPMPRLVVNGKVPGSAIRAARLHWGLTQSRMAAVLDVGLRVLRSLEYNEDAVAPDYLVPRIKAFAKRMKAAGYQGYTSAMFHDRLRSWTEQLGLDPNDYLGLARHLGLRRSTTWRWFHKPGCRPRRDRLDALDVFVEIAAERQRRTLESILGPAPARNAAQDAVRVRAA